MCGPFNALQLTLHCNLWPVNRTLDLKNCLSMLTSAESGPIPQNGALKKLVTVNKLFTWGQQDGHTCFIWTQPPGLRYSSTASLPTVRILALYSTCFTNYRNCTPNVTIQYWYCNIAFKMVVLGSQLCTTFLQFWYYVVRACVRACVHVCVRACV